VEVAEIARDRRERPDAHGLLIAAALIMLFGAFLTPGSPTC
jgi:hypothetical protein